MSKKVYCSYIKGKKSKKSIQLAFFLISSIIIILFLLGFFDLKYLILPDLLLVFFLIFSLLLKGLESIFMSLHGIFTFFAISLGLKVSYYLWRKVDGLGWGDVKLLTLSGFWVPFEEVGLFLTIIGGGGFLLGGYWRFSGRGEKFPLGALIVGILGVWVLVQGIE